ncbi:glycerophosphodiester phosphodiesterase family protein [Phycicoccus sp. CSK15P-2]|uniref:glycerophosphodiester phosphodiesterase family protein n=1 Tax=Phycicoccus sp. CSK15P-2 TaxID=2807627 RepID=UPI0027DE819C|nr:glycerophosphodiester phosphodiesterase family protein [Phycicoccus sp. CSK15P-2]
MPSRIRAALSAVTVLAATGAVATTAPAAAATPYRTFDLQAHRGGVALTVESTLPAFEKALRLGVSTLELDVQITEDGRAVVTHDRVVDGAKCRDTAPAVPGDPEWPYVGDHVKDLTLAQVRTLDCGSQTLPRFPDQEAEPGARMPLLSEVFDTVHRFRARDVMLNVETKVEAGAPEETAPREQFVRVVAGEVRRARLQRQVTVQSFDWGALMRMHEVAPELPLVALDNEDFLEVGQPGASPWLGGLDIDDFGGDPVAAVASFGASAWSPVQGRPQDGTVGDETFVPYVDRADVRRAHAAGLEVVPWTVDDRATMAHFMDLGVDGLITDRPDVLRDLMAERHLRLPRAYEDPTSRHVTPLRNAHAHNDYEHDRPLLDALDQGFTSVEADVWLVDGELLVAHDLEDAVPGRTLESLYLEPLRRRVRGGSVYPHDDGPFQLLVDIKSDGPATYAAVSRQLREYRRILTRFAPTPRDGAVEVVISGNRPLAQMVAERTRYAGYDGRMADLVTPVLPDTVMPLVSDNWANHFTWAGEGPMPAEEQTRLRRLVATAHEHGYRLRFWNTPDTPGPARTALWSVLLDSGVDHVNTDDLAGLADFLEVRDL